MAIDKVERVLNRFIAQIGPQADAFSLLKHLGDDRLFKPFEVGEEPNWMVVVAHLLFANPHISVESVWDIINRDPEVVRRLHVKV